MTITTDEAAILAAIRATPADLTPQLAYADWLEEHDRGIESALVRLRCALAVGDESETPYLNLAAAYEAEGQAERAELIRVQCELEKLNKQVRSDHWKTGAEYDEYRKSVITPIEDFLDRESALLAAHGREWSREVAKVLGVSNLPLSFRGQWFGIGVAEWRFVRGVVAEVRGVTLEQLEQLVGGPCENCDGTGTVGREHGHSSDGPCDCCGGRWESRSEPDDRGYSPGTGRVPGLAAALGAACPGLRRVRMSDREPQNDRSAIPDRLFWWYFTCESILANRPHLLPHILAPFFKRPVYEQTGEGVPNTGHIDFSSAAAAHDALELALAAYCRQRAWEDYR